jgi:hypothetical protein
MPRFYLHVRTPLGLLMDAEGVELADADRLRESMSRLAIGLVDDHPGAAAWNFEVRDERGQPVLSDCLRNLLEANAGEAPRKER